MALNKILFHIVKIKNTVTNSYTHEANEEESGNRTISETQNSSSYDKLNNERNVTKSNLSSTIVIDARSIDGGNQSVSASFIIFSCH